MKELWKLFFFICICFAISVAQADSRDALFDDDPVVPPVAEKSEVKPELKKTVADPSPWTVTLRAKSAYMFGDSAHLSNAKLEADFAYRGLLGNVKYKFDFRTGVDVAYMGDHYPSAVRRDERAKFELRENYLDVDHDEWSLRLGCQHIVWGELVGLFLADVVSARSYDRFEPTDLAQMRIPQCAARVERVWGDVRADFVWIPVPSYDKIGHPGADFYPGVSVPATYRNEQFPDRTIRNTNYGLRFGTLANGWDVTGFAYHSMDVSPTFARVSPLGSPLELQARHDPINQFGVTLSKDYKDVIFNAEAVYTSGRSFATRDPHALWGLKESGTFEYALGMNYAFGNSRTTLQFMQRRYLSYDAQMLARETENTLSGLFAHDFTPKVTVQVLGMVDLNRRDYVVRPQFSLKVKDILLTGGVDIFGGSKEGMFGRFDNNDRVFFNATMAF